MVSVGRLICFVWSGALFVLTGLLVAEYRFFKEQTVQLAHIKSEYATYKALAKKQTSDPKKGEAQPHFLLVNREPAYLKESALSFARRHNLEWALQRMYKADEWVTQNTAQKSKKKRNKRSRARVVSAVAALHTQKKAKQQQEQLLICPLEKNCFWLSSPFGPRKKPNGKWGFHTGIDLAAPRGTGVKAAGAGSVVQAGYCSGYGNCIVIAHDKKFKTRYAHLDRILVHVGDQVTQQQEIGKVGATGHVRRSKHGDGSHLHFEVYVFGKQVNPFYFLA